MRFSSSLGAVLAFASAAFAQTAGFDPITKPTSGEAVPAGQTYEIVWLPSAQYPGTIALSLLGGATPSTLQTVATIATGVQNSVGKYSWAVDKSLGALATYGIQITLESNRTIFQYGFPFRIVGGGSSSSTSASATGSTSRAASSSTTAGSSSSAARSTSSVVTSSSSVRPSNSTSSTARPSTVTTATSSTIRPSTTTAAPTTTRVPAGAATLAGGSFAVLGGLAVALLAM
jgi:hypothetical protein